MVTKFPPFTKIVRILVSAVDEQNAVDTAKTIYKEVRQIENKYGKFVYLGAAKSPIVRMNGLVLGVPQTLSYFEKMQDRIVNFVESNSKISSDDFRKLMLKTGELVMDVGTVLDGEGAVACGLIDELGGLCDALSFLNDTIEKGEQ